MLFHTTIWCAISYFYASYEFLYVGIVPRKGAINACSLKISLTFWSCELEVLLKGTKSNTNI